jgi:hypothetical protein
MEPRRPTREEIRAAEVRQIPDLIAEGFQILFCGINPGLYSAVLGYHFARTGQPVPRDLPDEPYCLNSSVLFKTEF